MIDCVRDGNNYAVVVEGTSSDDGALRLSERQHISQQGPCEFCDAGVPRSTCSDSSLRQVIQHAHVESSHAFSIGPPDLSAHRQDGSGARLRQRLSLRRLIGCKQQKGDGETRKQVFEHTVSLEQRLGEDPHGIRTPIKASRAGD